jgi:hypothetical protein
VALASALAGCSFTSVACAGAAVPAYPVLRADAAAWATAHPDGSLEVCVDATCDTLPTDRLQNSSMWSLEPPAPNDTTTEHTLRISEQVPGSDPVVVTKSFVYAKIPGTHPDDGCGYPDTWGRTFHLDAQGRLRL